jgi:hypothetical protein
LDRNEFARSVTRRGTGASSRDRLEGTVLSLPQIDGHESSLRQRFRPIRSRSILAVAGLASHAFISVVMILACALRIALLGSVQAHTPVSRSALRASDLLFALGASLHLLVVLFTIVTFLLWFYRAHQNLLAFRPELLENSPADAAWSFFIPFINLVKPYSVMREIWVESDPAVPPFAVPSYTEAPASPLVSAWWALFLARGVIGWAALLSGRSGRSVATLMTTTEILVVSYVVSSLAAGLACLLVLRILRRQENLAEQLTVLDGVGVF